MGNCSSEPQVHLSQRRPIAPRKKKSHLGDHPSDEEDSSESQHPSDFDSYEQEQLQLQERKDTSSHVQQWDSIFQEYGHKLVDPQDVHSILDTALSSTIHKLHSAEMTLVLRRVRKVVKSMLHNPKSMENGNSSSGNNNNGHEDKRKNSKAVYQKDHLLDEHLVRQIFIAGDRWMSRCEKEHTVKNSWKEYLERKRSGAPHKSMTSSDDTKTTTTSIPNRHAKDSKRDKEHHTTKAVDLIGAAYTIMLNLSESQWDYVAAIAKVSAHHAGLNLDVNHKVLQDDRGSSSKLPSPPPSSLMEWEDVNDLANVTVPTKDNGVTIQALSFLIALVLRGSRKQRLVFLFYLLLDPKILESLLENHPGGGVPSWLLEMDQDWALSFAGLGHYLFCEKKLKVGVQQAIETIGMMLSYSTPSMDFASNTATSAKSSTSESNFGNRKRALSYGDTKYHAAKMHIMLADYLHDVRTEKSYPNFENESEQRSRIKILDTFWDASYIFYTQSDQKYWTLEKFLSWADAALPNESSIDLMMHQIFGMGLLPTPAMERKLVADSWTAWQIKEARHLFCANGSDGHKNEHHSAIEDQQPLDPNKRSSVWGGIGGFDGRGGLGFGIMYCIDKEWWNQWQRYVKWEWNGEIPDYSMKSHLRPQELSTEKLLDRSPDSSITGSYGSYELMKKNLLKGKDYVLIPPGVWDILYELYGGGPPLPRMITNPYNESVPRSVIDISSAPMKVPHSLQVLTHPWVLECHVCDPHQPYRRGEAGHMSIRLMASPQQSLSRLFAEIVLRLPIVHPRGKDEDGRGRARLWKEINEDLEGDDRKNSSYGPWALLKDQVTAEFPVGENIVIDEQNYKSFLKSWNEYADHGTLDSLGLSNGMKLMFEYALVGKDGKFTWPREAAEKAGKMLRTNAEDVEFRLSLRGLDKEGIVLPSASQSIVGTVVDAMDSTGRWFQAEIVEADLKGNCFDDDLSDSTSLDYDSHGFDGDSENEKLPIEIRAVKIDFTEVGGHEEWISVSSDRLAVKGRFTIDSMKSIDDIDYDSGNKQNNGDHRSFGAIILRRRSAKEKSVLRPNDNTCLFPGFGACGLSNLGNTCYMNSAIQCISYMPLLRAYLISGRFRKHSEVNIDNPLGTGGKVLEELANLEETIWSGKVGVRYPSRFRNVFGRCLSQYSSNDQQDAQEFLNDLLDSLHEDSNKVIKKPYVEALEDKWVDQSDLYQVGEETWRRYLRRNRSIISNIGMGQVLNRVTCPVCEYTSHNFDPFNMLSIPFPTLSDVVFHCKLLRRATSFEAHSVSPIFEEYVVTLPRLADIGDLKHKLQELCGIPLNKMKIFVTNDSSMETNAENCDEKKPSYVALSVLPEKEGPCLQYARQNEPGKFLSPLELPTTIFVFESTLKTRPLDLDQMNNVKDDDWHSQNISYWKIIAQDELKLCGDVSECRSADTNPTLLAKSISSVMWPKSMEEVLIGLRVDAIDERGHWFPGSIVELSEVGEHAEPSRQKAKVHFDNFSTKWDLYFTLNDFMKGKVRPLHSHTQPKENPLEFLVYNSSESDSSGLFGTPFHLQFFSEWSVARAGAHILGQAFRFVDHDENENKVQRMLTETMDTLLEYDKLYMNAILSNDDDKSTTVSSLKIKCSSLQADLEKKLAPLLSNLPFDVYLCDEITLNTEDEEALDLFNYRLDGSIGNLMNARNGILLHWRKRGSRSFFREPNPVLHSSTETLRSNDEGMSMHKKKLKYSHGGMPLAVCLDEFCNEQNLSSEDCWRCPRCKEFREGRQSMKLWRLPDILTFHLKRFNCSAKWREKITTKINFPLTGLDMKQWCDKDSAALHSSDDSYVYDLIGVVNHYGGMTGGHYVAFCKATGCSPEGSEEVEHNFTGAGVHAFGAYEEKGNNSSTWKLGRNKDRESTNAQTRAAISASKAVAEGSEPLWLQFDDESVEPIPPRCVNSENAYVLFYRKRRISPYNIGRYSSME